MYDKLTHARHARTTEEQPVSHRSLKARATSALLSGCLAVSLCPAVALAAQPDQGAMQQPGNPPTMQQDSGNSSFQQNAMPPFAQQGDNGSAPSWNGGAAPSEENGEAPTWNEWSAPEIPSSNESQHADQNGAFAPDQENMPTQMPQGDNQNGPQQPMGGAPDQGPENSWLADQVCQYLSEEYGVDVMFPLFQAPGEGASADNPNSTEDGVPAENGQPGNGFKPGAPEDAPELPEGAINVQQIYDSVRDAMRYCHDNNVTEANFDDETFKASLSDYVTQADENRFKDVSDISVEPNTDKAAAPADAPANNNQGTPVDKAANDNAPQADSSFIGQIISFLMGLFGFSA